MLPPPTTRVGSSQVDDAILRRSPACHRTYSERPGDLCSTGWGMLRPVRVPVTSVARVSADRALAASIFCAADSAGAPRGASSVMR